MNNLVIYYCSLTFIVIALIYAYLPGLKLFFRSCEWEETSVLEPCLHSFRGLLHFISGKAVHFIKHFFPVSNALVIIRYVLFRDKYKNHFVFSLFFHIVNVILLYFVTVNLTSNHSAGLLAAILFGFTALIADTMLWVIMFPNIICMTTIFVSILTHPALIDASPFTYILFYTAIIIVPMIYETGLIAPIIAMSIFVIENDFDLITFATVLFIPIMIYFVGRRLVNGTLGMFTREQGGKSGALCFLGLRKSFYHIFAGMLKVVLGFFQCKFKYKVFETFFILGANFKSPLSVISCLLTSYMFYCVIGFAWNPSISTSSKMIMIIFPVAAFLHFAMISFNIQPWHNVYDPVRQGNTTSYMMYFPSAIISIPVAYVLISNQYGMLFISVIGVFVMINGVFLIRGQIKLLRPYTDSMQNAIAIYKEQKSLPYRGRRYLIEQYKLDGMFRDDMVIGLVRIGDRKNKIDDNKYGNIKAIKLFRERNFISLFHNIEILWDFYKISSSLNIYNSVALQSAESLNKLKNSVLNILHISVDDIYGVVDSNVTTFEEIEKYILKPYVIKMNISLRKVDNYKIEIEIKDLEKPDDIEGRLLKPPLIKLLDLMRSDNILDKDEIERMFIVRDKELGGYVAEFIKTFRK